LLSRQTTIEETIPLSCPETDGRKKPALEIPKAGAMTNKK
jgi:hypothetical protein